MVLCEVKCLREKFQNRLIHQEEIYGEAYQPAILEVADQT